VDGWVKTYRSVTEHWVWDDKPFSKGQAWLDIILMANYKDNTFPLGSEVVTVNRGSFITSELKLMERWGWSKSKLRYFLNSLEIDSMIVKKTDRKKTTITIVNYSSYQESETTEEPKKDHQQTNNRPKKDTNKKEKKERNINNEYHKKFSNDSFEMKCVSYLIKTVKEEMPNAKLPDTDEQIDKWCDSIEKMVRIDKRNQTDIWATLEFARTDTFWKPNIRSTNKFREKYETLYLQKKNKKIQQPKINKGIHNFPERPYTQSDYADMEQRLLNK
jgi:hypothetical protein